MGTSHSTWFGNEHPSLRRCWHPIGRVDAVDGAGPFPVRLLGDDYALFRSHSAWTLVPDACPHRFAPLSAGTVTDGVLQCAYHGWWFGDDGVCVAIPALDGAVVPPAANLDAAFAVVERFALLWAALDEPVTPLPEFPEWDDATFDRVDMAPQVWNAGAAQMADNFLDVAHFPFTHVSTIGDPDDQVVRPYEVDRDGWRLHIEHTHSAQALDGADIAERTMSFEFTAPHHVHLRLGWSDQVVVIAFFHQPVDAETTTLYCQMVSTAVANGLETAEEAAAFQLRVADEDRQLLERIRTKSVSFGPGEEVSTRADRNTVAMRQILRDLAQMD